jgi:hypothetical protein
MLHYKKLNAPSDSQRAGVLERGVELIHHELD